MLCYRYIVLMVYPPTYYMLISQLNSTSTSFFLQSYVILSPVLLYVVLIYIYKLYVYCSVPSYNHQKSKTIQCRCDRSMKPEKQKKMIPNPEYVLKILNCATTKINEPKSTNQQQNNLLISCIKHIMMAWHIPCTTLNNNPMLPQPITPQKAYHAFITWALVVAVTMPWF